MTTVAPTTRQRRAATLQCTTKLHKNNNNNHCRYWIWFLTCCKCMYATHACMCMLCRRTSMHAFLILVAYAQLCCIMFISHLCAVLLPTFKCDAHSIVAIVKFVVRYALCSASLLSSRPHQRSTASHARPLTTKCCIVLFAPYNLLLWLLLLCCVHFCCNLMFLVLLQIGVSLFPRFSYVPQYHCGDDRNIANLYFVGFEIYFCLRNTSK